MSSPIFFLGDWQVSPESNTLRRGSDFKQLEPKAMDVLLVLCHQKSEVLSADEIVDKCWGSMDMGDNPVHKAITQLRKALGDKANAPTYIETIRKRGYRIIAKLSFPLNDEARAAQNEWQGGSPFPGLSAFKANEANVFFGRTQQVNTLLESAAKQVSLGRAFCLILGPSGTGKSSLVNAGVLPQLSNNQGYDGVGVVSHSNLDFADVSQAGLFTDLASAMLDWEVNDQPVFDGYSAQSLADELQNNCPTVMVLCEQALSDVDCDDGEQSGAKQNYAKPQFFLFIDRLEVLLSSPLFSEDERQQFLGVIEQLACSGRVLIFSACRNDFYPLVVNQPSLMAGKNHGSHFDLTAPTRGELMQMIRLPAVAANLTWSFDEGSAQSLDEILCAEAANHPDSLPMLQYTLQELYLQRNDEGQLQVSVYQTLGGLEGAIGKKAEALFLDLPEEHQGQLAFVLSLLVTLSADGETITSRAARWTQLIQPSQKALVQVLVDNRLFVSHLQQGQACFSLAHEALLRRWTRASDWIATHRSSLEIKSRLQHLSAQWLAEQKSPAYLLSEGKPLLEAQSLQNNAVFTLDEPEQALIKASGQKAKVKRWLKGSVVSLLCVLTLTAIGMSYQSQQAQNLAQQKRLEAESLLGFMVGEFADKLRSVKRMDLLDGISNKALEYFSQQDEGLNSTSIFSLVDSDQNFRAQFQHAQTLGAMGEVAYSRNKNDEAEQAFSSAKVILDKLYLQQADNLELLKTLGANAFWLGQIASDRANFTDAKVFFEIYLHYSQVMITMFSSSIEAKWELSYAYLAIGGISSKLQNHSDAKAAIEEALSIQYGIAKSLAKEDISHFYIADTLEWLAETEEQIGSLRQSAKTRQKVQSMVSTLLMSHQGNADLLETLAYSYLNHARILYYLGDYSVASQSISSAIEHLGTLLGQDSSNQLWHLQLVVAKAYQFYLSQKRQISSSIPPTSHDEFRKIVDRASAFPSSSAIIVKSYQINGLWDMAQNAIELVKPRLGELVSKQPSNGKLLSALSDIYLIEAKQLLNNKFVDNDQRNPDSKIRIKCQEAILILEPIITLKSSHELLLPYVQAHDCLDKLGEVQSFVEILEKMQVKNYQF